MVTLAPRNNDEEAMVNQAFNLAASNVDRASLPVIDISGFRNGDDASRGQIGAALRAACAANGFFYVTGHGIPSELIQQMFEQTKQFFDLPERDKMKLDLANSDCKHGYEPMKRQTLEAGAPADLKEGYYIGRETASAEGHQAFFGANQWPSEMLAFRETMDVYYASMLNLSQVLMRGIALSLHLDENHFDAFGHDPFARLRLLHYPTQPANAAPGEKGAGAHTDFGGITILLQDGVGGLQVLDNAHGGWIHAAPVPGAFVVNLGDMIARWTNDYYRSTQHRVVNTSGQERYSIPFFYHGNIDHVVACIPTCLKDGEVEKYPTTTVAAHFQDKMTTSYKAA
jgi:isopenicillin N synthase-like dioxygenase